MIVAGISPNGSYMQRFFVDGPAVGLENRADRIAGKNLCMFGANDGVGFLDETNDRVSAARVYAILVAVKRRAAQAGFAAQDVNAIAPELLFDAFAVE